MMESKPEKIKPVAVYKTTPTFTIPKEKLQSFRDHIMDSIIINRVALMADGRTLEWVEKELAKYPEEVVKKPLKAKEMHK